MFLWYSYQSIILGYNVNQSLTILANLASGLFDQKYLRWNIHVPFWSFFHADRHINKGTNRKSYDVKFNNSQCIQKMT